MSNPTDRIFVTAEGPNLHTLVTYVHRVHSNFHWKVFRTEEPTNTDRTIRVVFEGTPRSKVGKSSQSSSNLDSHPR